MRDMEQLIARSRADLERVVPFGEAGLCAAQLTVEAPTLRRLCDAMVRRVGGIMDRVPVVLVSELTCQGIAAPGWRTGTSPVGYISTRISLMDTRGGSTKSSAKRAMVVWNSGLSRSTW